MSAFTEKEVEYLRSRRLGRMASVSPAGKPHVVTRGFGAHGVVYTELPHPTRMTSVEPFTSTYNLPSSRSVVDQFAVK